MSWSTPFTAVVGAIIKASDANQTRDNLNETAPAKVTTAGDLVVGTGPGAVARLPAVATGSVLKSNGVGAAPVYGQIVSAEITDGTIQATDLAFAVPIANTSSETLLGADVTLVNALTWYDVLSVSLGAGEWLLWAQAESHDTVASGVGVYLQLLQTTGSVVLADAHITHASLGRGSLDVFGRIVLGSTDTIKVQAAATAGSSQVVIRRDTGGPSSPTNKATRLLALRVA